jgi:hypothetical protein
MSTDPFDEPLPQRLRVHEPDAARGARVRARCLEALARGRKAPRVRRSLALPALLAGFSAAYLLAIAQDVLQLHGVR